MISIIMPTYNRARIIGKAIDSILNQQYTDFELIIVDDGSIDDTESIIKSFDDKRIKYIKLKRNGGASHARNVGIDNAHGDYITFHDSDDIMDKSKLIEQLNYMVTTKTDFSFCRLLSTNTKGAKTLVPTDKDVKRLLKIGCFKYILQYGNIVSTDCLMGKKTCFDHFRFNESLPRLQDYDLVFRISKKYDIKLLDKVLVHSFIQTDSISSNPLKLKKAIEIMKNCSEYDLSDDERRLFKYKLDSIYANAIWKNNPKEAIIYYRNSLNNKFNIKNYIKYTICKLK